MAKNHTTFESLLAEVNKRAEKQLAGPVAKRVENELHNNSQKVEGWNSRSSEGIGDKRNIVSDVISDGNSIELITMNMAMPNPRLPDVYGDNAFGTYDWSRDTGTSFVEMMEYGSWKELPPWDKSHKNRDARPIIEPTQETVNSSLKGQILSDIEKAFK